MPRPGPLLQTIGTTGVLEISCSYLPAAGQCAMTINSSILHCVRDTCTSCTVSVRIPGKAMDWLLT